MDARKVGRPDLSTISTLRLGHECCPEQLVLLSTCSARGRIELLRTV